MSPRPRLILIATALLAAAAMAGCASRNDPVTRAEQGKPNAQPPGMLRSE